MAFRRSPLGMMVNNYLMKMALPVAVWFVAEYMLRYASVSNLGLGFVLLPMMLVTPYLFFRILRRLRQTVLGDMMLGIQAWTFGVQMAFFAGLVEAMVIYVFHAFINPAALADNVQATIAAYEQLTAQLQETGAYSSMQDMLQQNVELLKQAPIPSAIETAIATLSNEILLATLYMIPVALSVRKKPSTL